MANKTQFALLKEGVETWNSWREKNEDTEIDLYGARLVGADLSRADLSRANLIRADLSRADLRAAHLRAAHLSEANLSEAHLSGANLSEAHLSGANLIRADLRAAHLNRTDLRAAHLNRADLRGAHLSGADLSGADLNGADLSGAHLSEADLSEAYLSGAHLNGADLSEAIVGPTSFDNVDLSQVKGLESTHHLFPSSIGIDTIYKSNGNIPEVFLRGCGVPDNFITFLHSLTAKAFDVYSCLISYSNEDEDLAQRLHNDLQGKGVRCWFAPEDLKIGDKFSDRIDEAIRAYDKLMLLLSNHSINSAWVRREVRLALGEEKQNNRTVLFPIRLDDAFMDTAEDWADEIRRTRPTGDFRNWKDHDSYQKAFERLLRDLQATST